MLDLSFSGITLFHSEAWQKENINGLIHCFNYLCYISLLKDSILVIGSIPIGAGTMI